MAAATVTQERATDDTAIINILKADQAWAFGEVTAAEFFSEVLDIRGYNLKTFYFKNTTDRTITLVCQVSEAASMAEPNDVKTITIPPGNAVTERVVARLNGEFDPYLRWRITANLNATVGALNMMGRFKER